MAATAGKSIAAATTAATATAIPTAARVAATAVMTRKPTARVAGGVVVVVVWMVVMMTAVVVMAVATVVVVMTVMVPMRVAVLRGTVRETTMGRVVDSHQPHGTGPRRGVRMVAVQVGGRAVVGAVVMSTIAVATVRAQGKPTVGPPNGDHRHQEQHSNHREHDEERNRDRGRHGFVLRGR